MQMLMMSSLLENRKEAIHFCLSDTFEPDRPPTATSVGVEDIVAKYEDFDDHIVVQIKQKFEKSSSIKELSAPQTHCDDNYDTCIKQIEEKCKKQQKMHEGKNAFRSAIFLICPITKRR